jgi:hypothetical protein
MRAMSSLQFNPSGFYQFKPGGQSYNSTARARNKAAPTEAFALARFHGAVSDDPFPIIRKVAAFRRRTHQLSIPLSIDSWPTDGCFPRPHPAV